jgi:hypothetical protein
MNIPFQFIKLPKMSWQAGKRKREKCFLVYLTHITRHSWRSRSILGENLQVLWCWRTFRVGLSELRLLQESSLGTAFCVTLVNRHS